MILSASMVSTCFCFFCPERGVDVQPPGCHIGGHQRACAPRLEVPERQVSLSLVLGLAVSSVHKAYNKSIL